MYIYAWVQNCFINYYYSPTTNITETGDGKFTCLILLSL